MLYLCKLSVKMYIYTTNLISVYFRYKLFRFYPRNRNESDNIFSTFTENEETEIWAMGKEEVDVMVTPKMMNKFRNTATFLHAPFAILIDDIERYSEFT